MVMQLGVWADQRLIHYDFVHGGPMYSRLHVNQARFPGTTFHDHILQLHCVLNIYIYIYTCAE